MVEIIQNTHEEFTSIIKYNDENSLSCIIQMAYISAIDQYNIVREMPSGKGFADFIFYSKSINYPSFIVELKRDVSAQEALDQISNCLKTNKIEKYIYNNPLDLCAIINSSDIIITTKLHVGIMGARFGKSVVSFSGYTEKIQRFYNQINEADRSISLKKYTVNAGYNMIRKYKDSVIVISDDIISQGENNLKKTMQYIRKYNYAKLKK